MTKAQNTTPPPDTNRPNIVLIMTDDQGWGQTGYYDHPVLKTPNLDAMAANGLRFDRFYAAAPVCSPTRASVFTGRSPDRTGVPNHGCALRHQERTLPEALKAKGYATGHFGKWHLNGLRGPGVPIFADDSHSPSTFGFDTWLSVTNYFDIDPIMSRNGDFVELEGDSSAIIVREAMEFIREAAKNEEPFFAVIWDGSPHNPPIASVEDRKDFMDLDERSQHHYGELVAVDRSIGVLRRGLRELGIEGETLVWFCSDNGGLPDLTPASTGGLRDYKGSVWEGGLRVPGVIEWPGRVSPRVTRYPASTMDIFPTVAELLGLPPHAMLEPIDGSSLVPLFRSGPERRKGAIPFRFFEQGALVDNGMKLVATSIDERRYELYDLEADPKESEDVSGRFPDVFASMIAAFEEWSASVESSVRGEDYPEGVVLPGEPEPHTWMSDPRYQPYIEAWKQRREYRQRLIREGF